MTLGFTVSSQSRNPLKLRPALGRKRLALVALLRLKAQDMSVLSNLPKGTPSEANVMTLREVCAYLQIHKSTLMRLIDGRKIPCFRIGYHYRFNREQIDEWRLNRG
jgi:excisionase family DNA binding protein